MLDRARRPHFSKKRCFALATTLLRGIRGFHRQLLLNASLLIADTPLSPMSRRIVTKLLTGMSGVKESIAVAVGTARHDHAQIHHDDLRAIRREEPRGAHGPLARTGIALPCAIRGKAQEPSMGVPHLAAELLGLAAVAFIPEHFLLGAVAAFCPLAAALGKFGLSFLRGVRPALLELLDEAQEGETPVGVLGAGVARGGGHPAGRVGDFDGAGDFVDDAGRPGPLARLQTMRRSASWMPRRLMRSCRDASRGFHSVFP